MTSGVYDNAMVSVMTGTVNIPLNSTPGTFPGAYCCLTTGQPTQGLATATYTHIENQMGAVNGYTAGGSLINTVVPTNSTHVTGFKTGGTLTYTTTGTITAEWLVPQMAAGTATTAANPLICFLDMGAQSVTNGTLTVTWNASGIFTLTVAAAA
jgi:hypothetical protein